MTKNRDSFDCNTCRWGRHCDKSNPAGSDIFEIKLDGENIKQNTCFLPEVDKESLFYIRLHSSYSDGHLFKSGGIADQPAHYMQAMRLINWLKMQELK